MYSLAPLHTDDLLLQIIENDLQQSDSSIMETLIGHKVEIVNQSLEQVWCDPPPLYNTAGKTHARACSAVVVKT